MTSAATAHSLSLVMLLNSDLIKCTPTGEQLYPGDDLKHLRSRRGEITFSKKETFPVNREQAQKLREGIELFLHVLKLAKEMIQLSVVKLQSELLRLHQTEEGQGGAIWKRMPRRTGLPSGSQRSNWKRAVGSRIFSS